MKFEDIQQPISPSILLNEAEDAIPAGIDANDEVVTGDGAIEGLEAVASGSSGDLQEDCGGEADQPRVLKAPHAPTKEQRRLHEVTHCPPRSWCKHCVLGQSADKPHPTVAAQFGESTVTRINMDFCFLNEDVTVTSDQHDETTAAVTSMTVLVMQETLCSSVWAYALESKSAAAETWMVDQVVDDIGTVGLAKERIIVKSDQEPAITDLQRFVAHKRSDVGTALENSQVGPSNSNGRIEREPFVTSRG